MIDLLEYYKSLYGKYGPQGWWPLQDVDGVNPTKTGSLRGYHPGDYSYPKTQNERFEICVGAILTQNTNWVNVEKALFNLKSQRLMEPSKIVDSDMDTLAGIIMPSGYYNQKAKKLKVLSSFYLELKGRTPRREELLSLWGVGPETADSILLYGYGTATFVVDAYTRRIFSSHNLFSMKASYDEIKSIFEKNLPNDVELYQEFHALIVEHAKHLPKK
ncbi:MAG: endonuclease III domain-containing protein [Oligoflexales bacterium]|nr:endonuclease III domain-containing protein [Oligoflexales bacterium]